MKRAGAAGATGELQTYTDRIANACHDGEGNLAIAVTRVPKCIALRDSSPKG